MSNAPHTKKRPGGKIYTVRGSGQDRLPENKKQHRKPDAYGSGCSDGRITTKPATKAGRRWPIVRAPLCLCVRLLPFRGLPRGEPEPSADQHTCGKEEVMNTSINITNHSTMEELTATFAGAQKAGRAPTASYLAKSAELITAANGFSVYDNGYAEIGGKTFWVLDYLDRLPEAAKKLPWLGLIQTARHIGTPYEKNNVVEMAVRALPVQQKNTVIMFYHWGSSLRSIAGMDFCTPEQSYLRLAKAIRTVQKALEEEVQ